MNKTLHLEDIPYCLDSCELFERIRDLPGAVFLDSAHPHADSGRHDILAAAPDTEGVPNLITDADEFACRTYFDELRRYHQQRFGDIHPAAPDIPFCGGLLGYIGYDCGNSLNKAGSRDTAPTAPATLLRAYDWCVIQDHLLQRAVLVAQPSVTPKVRRDLVARLREPTRTATQAFCLEGKFSSNLGAEQYREAFERIQAYIRAGDCYQVNLAQCFSANYRGDPWHAYRLLRGIAAAPFSAYLEIDQGDAVLSLSPERYVALNGQHVETSPIKGTRPRHADSRADQLAAEELLGSDKERAENLMIVDLLRNDLGRNCVPGSIHVDRLFEVQSFPTVHHLVSTISGELQAERSAFELLRDTFPGGSITGAPKRRAMEIIRELEPGPREVYCGTVAYISADGRMDSNIAIRTLLCNNNRIRCWGGGGIVADSQWQREYQETYDKVGRFLAALEQGRSGVD
jgi:para-aminobenzoate synthetase component 1